MAGLSRNDLSPGDACRLLEVGDVAVRSRSLADFARLVLPLIADLARAPEILLYVEDSRLCLPRFYSRGFREGETAWLELGCGREFCALQLRARSQPVLVSFPSTVGGARPVIFHPLGVDGACLGLLGTTIGAEAEPCQPEIFEALVRLLSNALNSLVEDEKREKKLKQLSTYMAVSSMLAQPLDLNELLETILYCCIDVASAEEASVLLLDEEKKNFCFYQIEGVTRPLLLGRKFPADRGIAGAVLQSQQAEIINDVQNDPRFYVKIDSDSGFKTRSMIVVPLTAGDEKIGVLSVLNKLEEEPFAEDERILLSSIAEEIAFAIRNARVFDYVVNTYCKQRQGQHSCHGCKRPLGSWTPCVKYRKGALMAADWAEQ